MCVLQQIDQYMNIDYNKQNCWADVYDWGKPPVFEPYYEVTSFDLNVWVK